MQNLVQIAKIFSDPNRVNIIALVLRDKEVCVCEICDTLALSQPLVSRHLKQMKKAEVLQAVKQGKWVHYSLATKQTSLLQALLDETSIFIPSLPKLVSCAVK